MNLLDIFRNKEPEPYCSLVAPADHSHGKKQNGVVLGLNPYTHEPIFDNSKNHVLVVGREASGKTTGPVACTAFTWDKSVFVCEPRGDVYNYTSEYRKQVLQQKVIKFEPFCNDDSSAKWNPLAEIRFRSTKESEDLIKITEYIGNHSGDSNVKEVLKILILHLAYKNINEGKGVPTLYDVFNFLSLRFNKFGYTDYVNEIMNYPHISVEEYFSSPNLFESMAYDKSNIYDFKPFEEHFQYLLQSSHKIPDGQIIRIKSQKELKEFILKVWNDEKLRNEIDFTMEPYNVLLVHPLIYASLIQFNFFKAAGDDTPEEMFLSTYKHLLDFMDPYLRKNICQSDFSVDELLDNNNPVSLYYVCPGFEYGDKDIIEAKFMDLFHNILLYKLLDKKEPKQEEPTLLLVFDNVNKGPSRTRFYNFAKYLPFLESYGIKMFITIRVLKALIYFVKTDEDKSILLENMKTKIYLHQPGDLGDEFEYFLRLSGNLRDEPLEAEELCRFPSTKSLIFIPNRSFFTADKISYWKHMKDKLEELS